jgi:ketol-acid reductoisomerase
MNRTISDTAEYGCYLYNHACLPLLQEFMQGIDTDVIGKGLNEQSNQVDNQTLIQINTALRDHPVEKVVAKLRGYMSAMKKIV